MTRDDFKETLISVIPAEAGSQLLNVVWIPAFAGMTPLSRGDDALK
jgi:hypothetical protein